MNRIILIGNGFDLAHGLETSYKHFIDWLWNDLAKKLKDNNRTTWNYEDDIFVAEGRINYSIEGNTDFENLLLSKENGGIKFRTKNSFFEIITQKSSLKNWVDIEEEYYQQLTQIVQNYERDKEGIAIKKLNENFEIIKQKLEEYLSKVLNNKISKIENMDSVFFDKFEIKDFPKNKVKLLLDYLCSILEHSTDDYYKNLQNLFCDYYNHYYGITLTTSIKKADVINLFMDKIYRKTEFLEKIYPENIIVVNFNYTKTNYLYSETKSPNLPSFNIIPINIHGELKNENNPIIFGYGDELADEYKEIERLKETDYFKNIKSIKYLKTDNYRQLLNFADSDSFQIYLLGHSCGNSDRTLLNTLFEHKNCVSIKPFFHEKETEDGTKINDYENIIINMARNFKDKAAFRAKVVNKTYCFPLPQIKKKS